jgi:hypothetical protein
MMIFFSTALSFLSFCGGVMRCVFILIVIRESISIRALTTTTNARTL